MTTLEITNDHSELTNYKRCTIFTNSGGSDCSTTSQ